MDIKLDEDGDVMFTNGGINVTETVADSVTQRLVIKFNTYRGEWWLNTQAGLPYYQEILGKPRQKATVDAIFQQAVVEEENIAELLDFASILYSTREYEMGFIARAVDGNLITIINPTIGI